MKEIAVPCAVFAALIFCSGGALASSILYDNGPVNGTISSWTVNTGYIVGDTFTLAGNSTVSGVNFGVWNIPGDSITSIDWSITSGPYSGTTYASGTALASIVDSLGSNSHGYNVTFDTFDTTPMDLLAGTYYLNLQNAVVPSGDPVYWDENDGASTAFESSLGNLANVSNIPGSGTHSESFQILGDAGRSTPIVPEPNPLLSFGTGAVFVGTLVLLRRPQFRNR